MNKIEANLKIKPWKMKEQNSEKINKMELCHITEMLNETTLVPSHPQTGY